MNIYKHKLFEEFFDDINQEDIQTPDNDSDFYDENTVGKPMKDKNEYSHMFCVEFVLIRRMEIEGTIGQLLLKHYKRMEAFVNYLPIFNAEKQEPVITLTIYPVNQFGSRLTSTEFETDSKIYDDIIRKSKKFQTMKSGKFIFRFDVFFDAAELNFKNYIKNVKIIGKVYGNAYTTKELQFCNRVTAKYNMGIQPMLRYGVSYLEDGYKNMYSKEPDSTISDDEYKRKYMVNTSGQHMFSQLVRYEQPNFFTDYKVEVIGYDTQPSATRVEIAVKIFPKKEEYNKTGKILDFVYRRMIQTLDLEDQNYLTDSNHSYTLHYKIFIHTKDIEFTDSTKFPNNNYKTKGSVYRRSNNSHNYEVMVSLIDMDNRNAYIDDGGRRYGEAIFSAEIERMHHRWEKFKNRILNQK